MAKRYGLVIDLERCIGCHACAVACRVENGISSGSWIRVETVGGTEMDTARGKYPQVTMHYLPRLCMHCAQPECQKACPEEAIRRREDGIVLVDKEKCTGCELCLTACPYDALSLNPETGVVEKCTLCVHRLEQGLEPFCVICCETEAMHLGNPDNPDDATAQLIARKKPYLILPENNGDPSVHYCAPLPPRPL